MQKILFLSINNLWTPHFETDLELMQKHKEDEIFVLGCNKTLLACSCNSNALRSQCIKCRSRFEQGMELLKIPKEHIFSLKKAPFTHYKFNSIEELKTFEIEGIPHGFGVASSLISEYHEPNLDTVFHRYKINKLINASISVYQSMEEVITKVKPDCCYFFNGRYADTNPAVHACKKYAIQFYTHERAGKKERYTLWKNTIPNFSLEAKKNEINKLWKGDKRIGKQWYLNRRAKVEQSWISFLSNQKQGVLPKTFDPKKRNIAIYNTASYEFELFPEYKEHIFENEYIEIDLIAQRFPGLEFYLRIHPNLHNKKNFQMKKLYELEKKKMPNLHIIFPEQEIDSYALLEACEKVIVFGSTVGVEACFYGKATILIGRAEYEGTGCAYQPKSQHEVYELIEKKLEPKPQVAALKYANWQEHRGHPFEYFQATDLFSGKFLGKEILPKLNWKQKAMYLLNRRLEVTRNSIQKRLK